jgi:tetratricopeptide (TPR) repeat protein
MAIYFNTKNRLIIPRWREYTLSSVSADHLPSRSSTYGINWINNAFIQRKIKDWEDYQSIDTAWELVNSSVFVEGIPSAKPAARFLLENMSDMSQVLRKMSYEVLNEPDPEEIPSENAKFPISKLKRKIGGKIRALRTRLLIQSRNELYWTELGRLYSILGLFEKARKCISIALSISKGSNRYLLRSASRFFYHLGDFEHAQQIIRQSPYLQSDPWLLSAEISYAIKQGRHSRNIKRGMELVKSTNYSNEALTELSGTLGTLEFINGSNRQAKKLTMQSLKAPNDNSLAQAEWMSRQLNGISIEEWLDNVDLAFEAKAFGALYSGKIDEAISEGINWFLDQPFSKRPVHFVSYICTVLTEEFDQAIEILQCGLKSNPTSSAMVNNLAFSHAALGQFAEAHQYLRRLMELVEDNRGNIIYIATSGFTFYRQKMYDVGREKYEQAILLARESGYKELQKLASAYFIREQFIAGEIQHEIASKFLQDLATAEQDLDIRLQLSAIANSVLLSEPNKPRSIQG